MKAFCICEKLLIAIYNKEITSGSVHSVFSGACNIKTDKGMVTLLSGEKEMSPMSLVVEGPVDFKKLDLSRNMPVAFSPEAIAFGNSSPGIGLGDSRRWFPGVAAPIEKCPEKDLLKNLTVLERGIEAYCKHGGIGSIVGMLGVEMPELGLVTMEIYPEDKIVRFIKSRFLDFIHAVACGDTGSAADRAASVIGFGPGLTPSMDDFIGGIMVSLVYLAGYYDMEPERIYHFNRQLISGAPGKTTGISLEMLKHSAEGETNDAVRTLMLAVLGGSGEEDILDSLKRTVNIGETSGSDIILGLYVGLKILTNFKFRGEWINEPVCRHPERELL